jgi:hypothetical protein
MNHDLDAALRDLASGAAAAHHDRTATDAGLVLDPTVRRVRRRRRARAAAAATGGLVVVTGLVIGGLALAQEPDPQPAGPAPTPSVTTPAPTPSATAAPDPTPARAPVVLPAGDATLPFGTCGSLTATSPAAPVDPAFTASVAVREPTVVAGGPAIVTTSVDLTPGTPTTYAAVRPGGAEIAVVQQGVVVGTASYSTGEHTMRGGFQGESEVSIDWLSLAVCAPENQPQVSAGAPLPAGEYELLPWSDVISLGTDDGRLRSDGGSYLDLADAIAAYGTPVTAVGTTVSVTVAGEADVLDPVPGTGSEQTVLPSPALPVCGEPAPRLDPANPLELVTDLPAVVEVTDLADFSAQLQYRGGGHASFAPGAVWAMVLSEGRVVGQSPIYYEASEHLHLAPGIPLDRAGRIEQLGACTPGDVLYSAAGTLPAGTYEVVIGLELIPAAGSADAATQWTSLVSEPRTLVVG